MRKERLMYPPTVLTYNRPDSDGVTPVRIPYSLYAEALANRKVGDVIRSYAGAPGTGFIEEKITRIDASGVYGVTLATTIRELQPWEVR